MIFSFTLQASQTQRFFNANAYKVENLQEVEEWLLEVMDVPAKEKPEFISFVYYKNGFDLTTEKLAKIISSENGNFASMSEFSLVKSTFFNKEMASVVMTYHDSIEDEKYIDKKLDEIIEEIIDEEMSDYEKIAAINSFLINNATYMKDEEKKGQSVRVLLEDGTGVCAAFANTVSRFLKKLGIENYYVKGEGKGVSQWSPHAWNKVKVEGLWYNFDAVWNLQRARLGFFPILLSDETIKHTHILLTPDTPACLNDR